MQRLPVEIMTNISTSLDLLDIFNLGLTCRQFRYLTTDENICRAALEAHASYSTELRDARSSRQYARTLRRLAKIRESIATATPYSVALVACANDFVYFNGMLCYTVGHDSLRLLNLHKSAAAELVIDTRLLLRSITEESLDTPHYQFRPIYYAFGIVSCLYTPKIKNHSRLLVIDAEMRQLLTYHRLGSHEKLFVRNNQNHLYYGTHSRMGYRKRWVLKHFSIQDKTWSPGHLYLQNLEGSDNGVTVCFEIIDDHFYGLSSLTSLEVNATDWTSYYYGFRFPVGSSRRQDMQLTSKEDMWRRQHEEGPIDDRWSTLSLEKDSATGTLMIVECRREWLIDDCCSTRTSYRTELKFSDQDRVNSSDVLPDPRSVAEEALTSLGFVCHENITAERRTHPPSLTHRSGGGSLPQTVTLTNCFIRSYNKSCETFVDLVNDPTAAELMKQRPQLRSISRLRPAMYSHRKGEPVTDVTTTTTGARTPNETSKISWFLPEDNTHQRNAYFDALDDILNPKGKSQHSVISGAVDDRSLVYAIGQRDPNSKQSLVFMSFDPSIRLNGLEHWPGGPTAPPPTLAEGVGSWAYPTPQSIPASALSSKTTSRIVSPTEDYIHDSSQRSNTTGKEAGKSDDTAWARVAPAMYLTMCTIETPTGFNFAYRQDRPGFS